MEKEQQAQGCRFSQRTWLISLQRVGTSKLNGEPYLLHTVYKSNYFSHLQPCWLTVIKCKLCKNVRMVVSCISYSTLHCSAHSTPSYISSHFISLPYDWTNGYAVLISTTKSYWFQQHILTLSGFTLLSTTRWIIYWNLTWCTNQKAFYFEFSDIQQFHVNYENRDVKLLLFKLRN